MSFNRRSITVFAHDYETTGVKVFELGVLQAALCFATVHQDGSYEILEKDVTLLNPGIAIEPGATAVHGYTDFDVQDKQPWEPYLREQIKVVNETAPDAVVSFNGNRFDNQIAGRVGWKPLPSLDLYKAAAQFKKDRIWEKANLGYAYEKLLGKPLESAHDAFADVIGTLDMIKPAMKLAGFDKLDDFHDWMRGADGTPDMVLNMGVKHKGKKLKLVPNDYLEWMLSSKCNMLVTFEMRTAIHKVLGIEE